IGKELPNTKDVQKEEKAVEQKQVVDNKFVKDLGEDLLTSTAASAYGVNFTKSAGAKIDKDIWGDALNGLKLKNTAVSQETEKGIAKLDNILVIANIERKMSASPFIQALHKQFWMS